MPELPPNIVLTGFMGTGKSTVGRRLADRLGRPFIDTDALIEQREGPIAEIFAEHGEQHFRDLEREVAAEVGRRRGAVVATGGRMLLDPANEAALRASGVIVCLHASAEALLARLAGEAAERPLLRGSDPAARIRDLLTERAAGYARFPQVHTDGLDPDQVADAVLAVVGGATGS
jgi:shikimate kinase